MGSELVLHESKSCPIAVQHPMVPCLCRVPLLMVGPWALRCRTSQVSSFRVQLSERRVINCASSSVVRHLGTDGAEVRLDFLGHSRSLSLPSFLRQGFALNLEFADSARLAVPLASGISLFPLRRC